MHNGAVTSNGRASSSTRLMDRSDAMRLFVRVVERGNFSGAAREIGIGQPAVSKQIASLETYLGAQLLVRTSRRLTLTGAGREFFQSASRLIVEFELAESSVGRRLSSPAGRVRVNIAPGFGQVYVTPRLPTFLSGIGIAQAPMWLFASIATFTSRS